MQELGKLFGVRHIEAKKVQRVRKTVHLQNLVLNVHTKAVERICGIDVCQQHIDRKAGTGVRDASRLIDPPKPLCHQGPPGDVGGFGGQTICFRPAHRFQADA